MRESFVFAGAVALGVVMAACGGSKEASNAGASAAASPAAAASSGGSATLTPAAGGKVITVQMVTDSSGNYFDPKEITAKRGDVIRYTLKLGVHNANFLPDSNPGVQGLPAAGPILQLPGQTYDVAVNMKPGTYFYQCDAHAALGMKGHLTVQ